MAQIPRGVRLVEWKNKDKSKSIRYRVRIERKNFTDDRSFDTLKEAVDFMHLAKSKTGQEQLKNEKIEQEIKDRNVIEFLSEPPISVYVNKYVEQYVDTRDQETELQIRATRNIKSLLNSVLKAEIDYVHDAKLGKANMLTLLVQHQKKPLKDFKLSEIGAFEINAVVKAKLIEGLKKSSVDRMISVLSTFYSKLKYIDKTLIDVDNPCLKFDKDLLKNRTVKVFERISDKELDLFYNLLEDKNKDFRNICMISLLTSMRKSECVTLTSSQIKSNYIQLINTKSGKPRKVFLTEEAQQYIKENVDLTKDKLFNYTTWGFDKVYNDFKRKHNLTINFHKLRKEAISRFLDKVSGSSVVVTSLLGISSVKKFEEMYGEKVQEIKDQNSLLKSVGHGNSSVTKNHYYSVKE